MKLTNSLTKSISELPAGETTVYSCGPTVYDHAHIGNLRTFITDDLLRRTIRASGHKLKAVMNITDVDDKTIAKSRSEYPDLEPMEALKKSTRHYENLFLDDLKSVGVDISLINIVRATDSIEAMKVMIAQIYDHGFAYVADGSVYFDLKKYRSSGHQYGRLTNVDYQAQARVDNDEYDKAEAQDFALWKAVKDSEPFWDFEIAGKSLPGRPGWHIECSAMALAQLGTQPITVHTGGIDLKFPHHENEIAQVIGATGKDFAEIFLHSNHLYVDGRKMSKSLGNIYKLADIVGVEKFPPMGFRLLVLESHYLSELNFTRDDFLSAAARWESSYVDWASPLIVVPELQDQGARQGVGEALDSVTKGMLEAMQNDLDTPKALMLLDNLVKLTNTQGVLPEEVQKFNETVEYINQLLGLELLVTEFQPLSSQQLKMIREREDLRDKAKSAINPDFGPANKIRDELARQGVRIIDGSCGPRWRRT